MSNKLKNLISNLPNSTKYIIDIGVSTGVSTDPIYQFIIDNNYKGLCIEGNSEHIPLLKKNISSTFDIYNGYITPLNILDIFYNYNVPISIDLLKIDIDGYDLEVIRTILTVYRPKVIIAEINEKIPPPILFEVKYITDYEWDYSHCFGFSLSSGEKVMNANNYGILDLYEMNNILCIDSDIANNLNIICYKNMLNLYKNRYINNPNRIKQFSWNNNINYWLEIEDKECLKNEIIKYFETNKDRSNIIHIQNIDFIISII
jgi:hypothetical protein